MNAKYPAAVGPNQAQGRAQAGPGPARRRAWAVPAAAWHFVFILYTLYTLDMSWLYIGYI